MRVSYWFSLCHHSHETSHVPVCTAAKEKYLILKFDMKGYKNTTSLCVIKETPSSSEMKNLNGVSGHFYSVFFLHENALWYGDLNSQYIHFGDDNEAQAFIPQVQHKGRLALDFLSNSFEIFDMTEIVVQCDVIAPRHIWDTWSVFLRCIFMKKNRTLLTLKHVTLCEITSGRLKKRDHGLG